ncbi:MAG: RluA family pseudouridine synthase [Caulobacterales bacterium]
MTISPADRDFACSLVIHEDAAMIAFDKPSGLAVQGGSGVTQSLEDLLSAFAKSNGKKPRLVHRLDRETSGVIVAARTKPAAALLSEAFAKRDVRKTYLAIVCGGTPTDCEGVVDLHLRKSSRKGLDIMEIGGPNDQTALTRYKTLCANENAALLEVAPETGRMHQIRAHLAAIGRPIAGDAKYGGLFAVNGVAVTRLMLHAATLDLPHPLGGRIQLSAPPPEAFADFASALDLSLSEPLSAAAGTP